MGISVRTNSSAICANNKLNKNNKKIRKNLEKLSSGFKINRAGDDASGLAISEKMREQITSLDTFTENVENGLSLVAVADGYLNEISDMLIREVELSLRAANGIFEYNERDMIQQEVDQLLTEIDRIVDTANFNGVPLFNGNIRSFQEKEFQIWDEYKYPPVEYKGDLPTWTTIDSASSATTSLGSTYTDSKGMPHAASYLDMSSFDGSAQAIADAVDKGFYTTCCTCNIHYSFKFNASASTSSTTSGQQIIYDIGLDGAQTADDIYDRIISAANNGHPNNHYTQITKDNGKLVVYDNRKYPDIKPRPDSKLGLMGTGYVTQGAATIIHHEETVNVTKFVSEPIIIQGDYGDAGKIVINVYDLSTEKLKIDNASMYSSDEALDSMNSFKAAIDVISSVRADYGALQNRMEYTINNLTNTSENISNSKSKIKDTDMAKEMMQYTQNNVIVQSAQSMLAQANTKVQSVLQLLQ